MKVAIIGSRNFEDYQFLKKAISDLGLRISKIISGGAKGADTLAEQYAAEMDIKTEVIKPDYDRFGRKAPLIRNKEIVKSADLVIAFWDGQSRGTLNAINHARDLNKEVKIFNF